MSSPSIVTTRAKEERLLRTEVLFQEIRSVNRALGESVKNWTATAVKGRWFVNSHPKSGTHLIRNILLHFNHKTIYQDLLFFNTFAEATKLPAYQIYLGHLPYSTFKSGASSGLRPVLLLRHPGAIALALARAFYDVNTSRADHLEMREHCSFEEIVKHVVCGYSRAGLNFAPLATSLSEFCVDWLGGACFVMRFEDIVATLQDSKNDLLTLFSPIFGAMFEAIPADATNRIRAGSAGAISATYSRTAGSLYDGLVADDVYRLLSVADADRLRSIAATLGY